jgi:chromate transporter
MVAVNRVDATHTVETPPAAPSVAVAALFWGFLKIGLSGFGGVLPFARRTLVERERWLTEQEFTEVLSLSQFLPGPNIVNVSIIVGRRFQRGLGSLAATLGLMLMPLIIVMLLATLYAEFAQIEAVRRACNGVSAAASGLVFAMAAKLSQPIRRNAWQIVVCAATFGAIGIARVPLLWALAALVPVSLVMAWHKLHSGKRQ